jgi:hypothetical protein
MSRAEIASLNHEVARVDATAYLDRLIERLNTGMANPVAGYDRKQDRWWARSNSVVKHYTIEANR